MKKLLILVLTVVLLSSCLGMPAMAYSLAERYEAAELLMVEGKYLEAAEAFDALMTYSDASNMAMYCRAVYMAENKMYSVAVDAFQTLGDFKDSTKMAKYYAAMSFQDAGTLASPAEATDAALEKARGNLRQAKEYYAELALFKDCLSRLAACNALIAIIEQEQESRPVSPYQIPGSYVFFGHYPQTSAGTDSTPIEWLVLDYDPENCRALLISRYGLDTQPYHTQYKDITWAECSLRAWLNNAFLNKAFTNEEQRAIRTTDVDNGRSQCHGEWHATGGSDTQDRIFLLSYAEGKKYLGIQTTWEASDSVNNVKARAAATAYGRAGSKKNETADGKPAVFWWLRSPGSFQSVAACVVSDGSLLYFAVNSSIAVRPALWIDLNADIF